MKINNCNRILPDEDENMDMNMVYLVITINHRAFWKTCMCDDIFNTFHRKPDYLTATEPNFLLGQTKLDRYDDFK